MYFIAVETTICQDGNLYLYILNHINNILCSNGMDQN